MPFDRPTLQEITDRIESDLQTRLGGSGSLLRRSVLAVMARVYAGAVHLLYEFLVYASRQLFASKADAQGLNDIAGEYGITRQAATPATGTGTATGTNGSIIPSGSELQSGAGIIYTVDDEVTIAAGTAVLALTSASVGDDTNVTGGASLTFVSPIAGVNTTVTVSVDGLLGGGDEETDDGLRARVLTRKRQPPHGGAAFDYVNWALEYPGVTRGWSFPQYMGVGTIGLAFVRDDDSSIVPTEAQRDVVREYILEHTDPGTGLQVGIPVTAEPGFFVISLTAFPVNFEINVYPNTSVVQAAVEENILDLLRREGGPEQTIYLSRIREAISLASGEEYHTLVLPAADVTAGTTQVHVLGTITWGSY